MNGALKTAEGIAAIAIAFYVASVGTFQWFTSRDKVRLDLYNRRFDVYTRAIDFMLDLLGWTYVTLEDRRAKHNAFMRAVRESRFLFVDDPRIWALLEEFNLRSFKVTGFIGETSPYVLDMPKKSIEACGENESSLEWITESTSRLEAMLVPYLGFRHRAFKRWHWQWWRR
jgi:hypothetical protein